MMDKKKFSQVFIGIVICLLFLLVPIVVVFFLIDPVVVQPSQDIVHNLDSPTRYIREQTIIALKQMDPVMDLESFKRNYMNLFSESRTIFTEKVLPYLNGEQVDSFFLEELRAGFKVYHEIQELAVIAEEKMPNLKLLKTYGQLYQRYQWWRWVTYARSDMSYVPSYNELYEMFMRLNERGFPLSQFAQALNKRDPNRSQNDFTNLLFENDKQIKLRGIWALEAIKFVPDDEIIKKYYKSEDIDLLEQSDQYILTLGRDNIDLLLSLVDNPSERVSSMAEYRLRKIAYLTSEEKNEVVAGAATAQQKAQAWHVWWEQHKDDSDQSLRNQAASKLIAKAEQQLTKELLNQLAEFYENSEIYTVFNKALLSDDIELKKAALERLSYITVWKNNKAPIEIIINFYENLPLEEYKEYAQYLVQIDDERIRSIFLKTLEIQRGEDIVWRRNIARAMGETGQKWTVEPLSRMIIEDGSSNAAGVFTLVEGVDAAVQRLLDALIKEENNLKRYAIVKAIKTTGASGLPEKLTKALKETPIQSGSTFQDGIRFDILSLMEIFPDPNAKPVLLDMLKSSDPWDILGATRVLGKLGDNSGVDALIQYIKPTRKISASFYNHQIGSALQAVGSKKTKELLEKHFEQGDTEVKKLTINIMAQQVDTAYIPFFEKQLKSSNLELVTTASQAISRLIYEKANQEEDQRDDDFNIDILNDNDLPPIKTMLLWAFFDTKIFENHKSFPNHRGLIGLKGAVLRVNRFQQIEFDKNSKNIKLTTPSSQSGLTTSNGIEAGKQKSYALGSIERAMLGDYMTIFLDINYGGASCLFKRKGKKWNVIAYVGGVRE